MSFANLYICCTRLLESSLFDDANKYKLGGDLFAGERKQLDVSDTEGAFQTREAAKHVASMVLRLTFLLANYLHGGQRRPALCVPPVTDQWVTQAFNDHGAFLLRLQPFLLHHLPIACAHHPTVPGVVLHIY